MSSRPAFTPEHSRITVGIVTYNSAKHIAGCLESILIHMADAMPTIVVLDNASKDDTVNVVNNLSRQFHYPVNVILSHVNKGYAWAANRICESARTEWLCLINPDARLSSPAFGPAVELARRIPTCGITGGIITDSDGNPQECGGIFPTPLMAIWDWCGIRHLFPRKNWSTTIKLALPPDAPPQRIDYPTGAFWIFRREVYSRVGPFDERFFLYFEETDFCLRAKAKGWRSFILPAIRIQHLRGGSISSDSAPDIQDPMAIYFESLIKFLTKHFPKYNVRLTIAIINLWLKFRALIKKDQKSNHLFETFSSGLKKASQE